jgi:DNA-binding beta-propeller fold protein YncE
MHVPRRLRRGRPAVLRRLGAAVAALGLVLVLSSPGDARVGGWQVLGAARQGPTFFRPAGVGLDRAGNVYVSDAGGFRVVKLSQAGDVLASWGRSGSGPGAFGARKACSGCEPVGPGNLAVGRKGVVYVDDPANSRIEVFSSTGKVLAVWHPGLAGPLSLAVDGTGDLLAAGQGNEIVRLSSTGKVVDRWRIEEAGHDGVTVASVAAGPRGDVYAAGWWPDSSHPLYQQHWFVQRLTADGQKVASWQDVGGVLAVGSDGAVYVGRGATLDVLDPSGGTVSRWGKERFTSIVGLALDGNGYVYAADDQSNRVVTLSPQDRAVRQWGVGVTAAGRFVTPWNIGLAGNGDVYVGDAGAQPAAVQRLSPTGKPRARWLADAGRGLGVDRQGNVYVLAYPGRAVVRRYSPTGRLAAEWPLDAPASALTADARGDVYVLVDCSAVCVEVLRDGRPIGRWELPASAAVVGDGPVTLDAHGNVYVTELLPELRYGIGKISLGAEPGRATVDRVGSGSWSRIAGIAADARGNLYVSDEYRDRVQELSAGGKLVATWGERGSLPGQFHEPAGVAVDARGNVYVADSGNSRIQKLSLSP